MDTTSRATAPPTPLARPSTTLRAVSLLGAISGGALIVDTVTITVINDSFDPLDSILFLVGLVGMLLTTVGLAAHVSAGRRGPARVAVAVVAFLVALLALGLVSTFFDQVGRHVFSPANRGLHGEWSFFSIGVSLLVVAAWARRHRPGH